MWERVALIEAAQCLLPVDPLDASTLRQRVLLIADAPDSLAAILAHIGYEVRYALAEDFVAGRSSASWASVLESTSLTFPESWQPFDWADAGLFDAMISPLPCLFERSRDGLDTVLSAIHPHMQAGALFLATAPVQINEIAYDGALSLAEWKDIYAAEGPLGARGFVPIGGVDARIPLDAAVRYAFEDNPQETLRGLSYGFFSSFITSALLSAVWPIHLKPGPDVKLALPPPHPKPWNVAIPYMSGGGVTELAMDVNDTAPDVQGLAARAAQVLDSNIPSQLINSLSRNLLPFAVTSEGADRTPVLLSLPAEGDDPEDGPWLIVTLDAGDAQRVVLQAEGQGVIYKALTVIHGLGAGPISIKGLKVIADAREGQLGRVALALRFASDAVLSRLLAWTEP
jgi:hypothetical protein